MPGSVQGIWVEADAIMLFKRLLDIHTNMQELEEYGSHAGTIDLFNLESCSAQILLIEWPVPAL